MAQRPKIINTRQSYVPIDPETFVPQSYTNERSDAPDEVAGAVAYDGKNFMPTPYGYRSFFGLDEAWEERLGSRCQELVFFQLDTLENIAIALCEDGIWIKKSNQPWKLVAQDQGGDAVNLADIPEGIGLGFDPANPGSLPELGLGSTEVEEEAVYYPWTYCIIENVFYAYRAASSRVWKISAKDIVYNPVVVSYEQRSFDVWASTLDGLLPVGVYTAVCQFGYYETTLEGELVESFSELIDLGQEAITTEGQSFQIRFDGLNRPPNMILVYYQKDGGPWHREVLYPTPQPVVNILWTNEGELAEVFPPPASVIPAGQPIAQFPTFLNMAGQQGIFRAGFQLGFWDSANAVACSSVNDLMDFEPSVETLASVTTYSKVTGRIVTIIPEENNFIIYATRSIVRCVNNVSATQQWEPDSITHAAGIAYPSQVAVGSQESDQYVYTSVGLARIRGGEFEIIFPEVYDVLKAREEEVVYLKMLEGRYLFISSFNPVFAPVIFDQTLLDPKLLVAEGGGCDSLQQFVLKMRKDGPTLAGEMAILDYYLSGKPGPYWSMATSDVAEDSRTFPYPRSYTFLS